MTLVILQSVTGLIVFFLAYPSALASTNEEFPRVSVCNNSIAGVPNLDQNSMHPLTMVDPAVFLPSQTDGLVKFFNENGYVVIDHISEQHHRNQLVQLIDRIVARKQSNVQRLGFLDLYHDASLANLRQDERLYGVFASIFATEKLWVVFDRVMYSDRDEIQQPLPPHVDQNPVTHPNFFNVQGMLALRDMNEGTGTLALVPQSHKFFGRYAEWAKVGGGHVEFQADDKFAFIGLRLREGQIVIWDSRTTHSRFRGEAASNRYAALLTFTKATDDPELIGLRQQYFREGIGWNNHNAGLRATAKPRFDKTLREHPEQLTPLGRKLYGLDSWFGP